MNKKLKLHLKDSTYALHEWLEESGFFNEIKNNSLSIESYSHLLSKLYVFINTLEIKLKPYTQEFEAKGLKDIDKRLNKKTWLEEDLESLNITFDKNKSLEFKSLDNFDSIVGALYVIEGSTMGGMQIVKMLEDSIPSRYYQSYKQETMPMWMSFAKWLDETEINKYEATLGAMETFIILKKHLDSN